jgi:hypothetical protein
VGEEVLDGVQRGPEMLVAAKPPAAAQRVAETADRVVAGMPEVAQDAAVVFLPEIEVAVRLVRWAAPRDGLVSLRVEG